MALLNILKFPDSRLRKKAKPIAEVDREIQQLADDMLETMYDAEGIGLAATQVDVQKRLVVMDLSEEKNSPLVFINPKVEVVGDGHEEMDEGCLSVPGFYETVERPNHVIIHALDKKGQPFSLEDNELLAVCIQHEIDHLNGKLFIDYLSPLKRQRIRKKLEKQGRLQL